MIKVLLEKIEAVTGVNTNGVKPKEAPAGERADRQKDFVTALEHFLNPLRHNQETAPQGVSNNRISERASYMKDKANQKRPGGVLFNKNKIRGFSILDSKKLHPRRADGLQRHLRIKARIAYLKKRTALAPQQSEKGKTPYSRLSKHMYDTAGVWHKNRKVDSQSRGNPGLENGERKSRIAKDRKWVMVYRRQEKPKDVEGSGVIQTSKESRGRESAKDLTFVCTKYEHNVPKVETGMRAQAQNYIHRKGDEVFSEIVKQFTLIINRGGGEARVVLEPPALGSMRLNIKLHNSEVNTHIVVENMAVKDMIESRLTMLQNSLLGQGFTLGSFSVEVKEKNTSPQMTGDRKNTGALANSIEDGAETDQNIPPMAVLPWISTIVNITV